MHPFLPEKPGLQESTSQGRWVDVLADDSVPPLPNPHAAGTLQSNFSKGLLSLKVFILLI